MKHFTPTLLEQFRSSDEEVAETAAEQLERAAAAYANELQQIRSTLPTSFCDLLDRYYLHDAQVAFIGWDDRELRIDLRLDAPPCNSLLLHYELAGPASTSVHVNSQTAKAASDGPIAWLYDEVEIMNDRTGTLRHSILLTNDLELRVDFRGFRLIEVPSTQVLVSGTCSHSDSAVA